MTLTFTSKAPATGTRVRRFFPQVVSAPRPAESLAPVSPTLTVPLLRGRGNIARDTSDGSDSSRNAPAPSLAPAAPVARSRLNRFAATDPQEIAPPSIGPEGVDDVPAIQAARSPVTPVIAPAPVARSRLDRFAATDAQEIAPPSIGPDSVEDDDAASHTAQRTGRSADAAAEVELEEIIGILESVRTFNDWSVGAVWIDSKTRVKVIGAPLGDLIEGAEYHLKGRWRNSDKHGESLDVIVATPHVQADRASIRRFLERHFEGVGPKISAKYLAENVDNQPDPAVALENLREKLLLTPWLIDFSEQTGRAQFKTDEKISPALAFVHRDLATRVGAIPGMKDGVLKLLAAYAIGKVTAQNLVEGGDGEDGEESGSHVALDPEILQKCWALLSSNPYAPISDVDGYGFVLADAMGSMLKIEADSPMRLKALIKYALDEGCQRGGHVFLTHLQLKDAITAVDRRLHPDTTIQMGMESGQIIGEEVDGRPRYYTPGLYDAETTLARRVARLCEPATPLMRMTEEAAIELVQSTARRVCPHLTDGLDETQAQALAGILTSTRRLHTLTAGPGCGKTALMEVLQAALKAEEFCFVGPTGKSAKVLNNRLRDHGHSAGTIHSTLQGSGRSDFLVNEDDPLMEDVLVVDESGMADLELADGVFAAVHDTMHVILLGDIDQLASVSPGNVLRDLVRVKEADHHRLLKTHRNSGGILEVIEQVRNGTIDCVDRKAVRFSHGLGEVEQDFPRVTQDYIEAVGRHGFENVILLMSKRKGNAKTPGWNTTFVNDQLREMCNPHAEKIAGSKMFVNDRVIIRNNMTVDLSGGAGAEARPNGARAGSRADDPVDEENTTRVVNGDTGTIVGYERPRTAIRNAGVQHIRIKLDDGRMVDFPGAALEHLQHAYALTVHSGQGSEYKSVIVVATPGAPGFVNRAMLFTGISRARDDLKVYGEDRVLRQIAATPMPTRNSGLVRRIMTELGATDDEIDAAEEEGRKDSAPSSPPANSRLARFGSRVAREA